MKILVSIAFILLSLINNVYSQKAYTPEFSDPLLDKYRWKHFEELSGKNFTCFSEGKNGTMWFGIEGGVMSYDGYKWTEYARDRAYDDIDASAIFFHGDTLYYLASGIRTLVNGKWSEAKYKLKADQLFDDMPLKGRFIISEMQLSEGVLIGASAYGIYIRKNGQDHFYTNQIVKQRQDTIFKDLKFHVIENFGSSINFYCSNILDVGNNTFYAFYGGQQKHHFKFKITDNDENPLVVSND